MTIPLDLTSCADLLVPGGDQAEPEVSSVSPAAYRDREGPVSFALVLLATGRRYGRVRGEH
jgi:hypothetical protein